MKSSSSTAPALELSRPEHVSEKCDKEVDVSSVTATEAKKLLDTRLDNGTRPR